MEPVKNFQECQDSFLVCALQFDGRGDIYGGHEIALRMQKLMPQAKIVFTVIQPCFDDFDRYLFSDKVFVDLAEIQKQENWEIEPEASALKAINTFKRIIIFPTYQDAYLPLEILKRNEDVIKLREYGVEKPKPGIVKGPTYTLGIAKAKGEKGVLLPMEFSEKLPAYKEETPLERLSHLKNVHPALSKAILGEDFSVDSIQKFHKTQKLYLGYFSQPGAFFCYISALLTCKEGDLVICNTQKRPDGLINAIKRTLWDNGFGAIKIVEFTDEENSKEQTLKFKGANREKTCTIIFRGLSGVEMDVMLDATEDETLTTGDNSPLRFLAHRKTIAYDTRHQKQEYAESMIDLAAKFDPRFKDLLAFAFFGDSHPGDQVDANIMVLGMIDLFKAMKDTKLKANWYRFIEELFANYDFAPELKKILQERMPEFSK